MIVAWRREGMSMRPQNDQVVVEGGRFFCKIVLYFFVYEDNWKRVNVKEFGDPENIPVNLW